MDSLRDFLRLPAAWLRRVGGLSLGWVISALTGIATLLGAKEAKADDCDWWSNSQITCYYDPGCPSITPYYCYDQNGNSCCTT